MMYDIKILEPIKNIKNDETVINRILLAKKQNDINWRLVYIQLLYYECDEDGIIYPDNQEIWIDEDLTIVEIKPKIKKKPDIIIKMCNEFITKIPDEKFHANTESAVKCKRMISCFHEWQSYKKTKDVLIKFTQS